MGVGLDGLGLSTWRAVGASVAGAGHRARQIGCEDACAVDARPDGNLLVVVADGAGSARLAARGSQVAVAAAVDVLRRGGGVDEAFVCARTALEDRALADGVALGELATTLLVVRMGATSLDTAQIGDGALVVRRNATFEVPAPDEKGEYLNETTFLTSSSWWSAIRRSTSTADGIDGIAVLTDGLQLVAFDVATGTPHAPFFEPFLSFAANGGGVDELASFLGSDRVAHRTDDDVTLVVAARPAL